MRQVERWEVSPILRELALVEMIKRDGVRAILFDADDTLWPTVWLFRKFMAQCWDYCATLEPVAQRGGLEAVKQRIIKVNDECFEEFGVNPTRWKRVMEIVGADFGIETNERQRAVEILMEIYNTPVGFYPGVKETLLTLRRLGIDIGVVTHANEEWTRKKFQWSGLSEVLPWENVFVVGENGHKSDREWAEAVRYFGYKPESVWVAGDSPRSDARPCWKIGVKQVFLVSGGVGGKGGWALHQVEVDPRTILLPNGVSDLMNVGQEMVRLKR